MTRGISTRLKLGHTRNPKHVSGSRKNVLKISGKTKTKFAVLARKSKREQVTRVFSGNKKSKENTQTNLQTTTVHQNKRFH